MRKLSRRQKEIREKTQNNVYSNLAEAIKLLKTRTSNSKLGHLKDGFLRKA